MFMNKTFTFNKGKSTWNMAFHDQDNSWHVWREDSGHIGNGMMTSYRTRADALEAFNAHTRFALTLEKID